ncbi:hypothetical protein BKK79_38230 (plasmid) [Cupriavidus sp. USMAA2-4]|jgi:hypothetical protein|uniref:hypothetical protein n=1 Tax=Cupriavidus sp. USMAA2-4 TaxID=876364 RepID=UPI0008A70187|nr:hypothetical protein [Cupriavidus sp. USMAA2-4]AOY97758.1 hypothetical protein BKK79_38230 [Cupriavidus sp. USMAA2-4]
MELLEIQKLHEQYAQAPLTIEMPSRIAAPKALPGSAVSVDAARKRWDAMGQRTRSALLVIAGAAAAGLAGMGVASLRGHLTDAAPVAGQVAAMPSQGSYDMPSARPDSDSNPAAGIEEPASAAAAASAPSATPLPAEKASPAPSAAMQRSQASPESKPKAQAEAPTSRARTGTSSQAAQPKAGEHAAAGDIKLF